MKPKVATRCVADTYAGANERIVEFSHRSSVGLSGGLIALRETPDGRLRVDLYCLDPTVDVVAERTPARRCGLHADPTDAGRCPSCDLARLDAIVRALADGDPFAHEHWGDGWCSLCEVENARRPAEHEPECPWRLAVEWAALPPGLPAPPLAL